MSNKLDPVHAVASMALALVDIQKDLNQLHRKFIELTDTLVKMDTSLRSKFKSVDDAVNFCFAKLSEDEAKKEVPSATDQKGVQDNEVDEEDLRSEESEGGVLRDDRGEEAQGGTREKQKEIA